MKFKNTSIFVASVLGKEHDFEVKASVSGDYALHIAKNGVALTHVPSGVMVHCFLSWRYPQIPTKAKLKARIKDAMSLSLSEGWPTFQNLAEVSPEIKNDLKTRIVAIDNYLKV